MYRTMRPSACRIHRLLTRAALKCPRFRAEWTTRRLALCKGLREIGTIVSHFDESEIKEIFDEYMG